jgi:hypothetical protein
VSFLCWSDHFFTLMVMHPDTTSSLAIMGPSPEAWRNDSCFLLATEASSPLGSLIQLSSLKWQLCYRCIICTGRCSQTLVSTWMCG